MDKEKKRRIAYEVMILMGVLLLFALITRVWPVIFLVFLGMLIGAMRMLFLSIRTVRPIVPAEPAAPKSEPKPVNEQSIISGAFQLMQIRVTENLMARYPGARWVWLTTCAMDHFAHGEELIVMLNGAGGFAKAKIICKNLLFCRIEYIGLTIPPIESPSEPDIKPEAAKRPDSSSAEDRDMDGVDDDADEPAVEVLPINYERLAFDWVESRLSDINAKTNEALAKKKKYIFLPSEDLPHPDSWPDVCEELKRNGFSSADINADGINLKIPD